MQNKKFKRLSAVILAAAMVLQSFGGMAGVSAAETTQMTSEKEVVYANVYSDTARELDFNDNWKFYLGEASGAEANAFDDSAWENVNVPHDYSIEQEYTGAGEAESGYLLGGTGWYRKHFTLADDLEGKEIRIDFGGVYMNATVWVNGTQLGTHPFGYTPFSFDITDYVNIGEENVITVKVDHKTPSSRWYSGSGIYRSVNLTVMDKVHVDLYGTKISTPNLETEKNGTVNMSVKTTVANAGSAAANVVLTHTVFEKGTENSIGTVTTAAQSVAAGQSKEISATLPAAQPKLWNTKTPNLYTVVTEVKVGGEVVDTYETEYGFRYVKFDRNTGFYLNGENVKLKGVCMHHDQGSLGSEAHYRAIERQVEILKDMGCNSIRVTHNPAADELIEICNEKGILVIDEFFDGWHIAKNGNYNDYSVWFAREIESGNQILGAESGMLWSEFDLKATIGRGENAPSVIMWSLGNEIQEGAGGTGYATWADSLIEWCQETGTTKILTIGSNAVKNGNAEQVSVANKITAAGGVSGTNYSNGASYDNLYNSYSNWLIYGSETASHVNSRGVYDYTGGSTMTSDKELTAYDYSAVGWGATASSAWYDVITRDFVAGEYVWTGFDYMGEPTPWNETVAGPKGPWPSPKNSYFGIIDTAGLPKDNYYFYQSQWNDEVTTLHVLPAWNRDVVSNVNNVPVVVYSDAASVKLTLTKADGTVTDLGTKTFVEKTTAAGYKYQMASANSTNSQDLYFTWYVPFQEGTLKATAYDRAGNEITNTVGRSFVTTTGEEAKLDATVDRETIKADGKDLAYITVDVTDANGNIVPDAANNVTFTVEGDGVLVGVDNGKQADHQSFQDDNRDAYNGSLIAIVQSTKEAGEFTVTASAAGLQSDSVTVTTESTGATGDVSFLMSKNYYVKVGNAPQLPATIETTLADGSVEALPVVWDAIDPADYAKVGSFAVAGTVDGKYSVSVTVNMIDEVGGLLNYSATTPVGVEPALPAARPAVLVDGTILDATFPITWNEVAESDYAEAGTFEVEGTADVFGTAIKVTASIRVQEAEVTIGESISYQASKIYQDIPVELQSDTLAAVKDGATVIGANNGGDANETAWSNFNASQAGDNTAEITLEYDTQQNFGEIVIHFWKDGYAAEFPDAGTTKIYISETGNEGSWTEVKVTETIGTETERVKPYTYSCEPFTATFVKVAVTNSTAQKTATACTGITEIELKKAITNDIVTNSSTGLSGLKVNDRKVSAREIASGCYYTLDETATVVAKGKDNAAVTVLPAYNDVILVITESENHLVRDTFTIYLGQEKPLEPDDDSKDYPVSDLEAISDSEYPGSGNEGPDDLILDGNDQTHWHTNYNTNQGADVNYRWIGVKLPETTEIDGIRYLPRCQGNGNGAVTEYKAQYSTEESGNNWIDLATGTWEAGDRTWKLISFKPVEAKRVRVVGVHTVADGNTLDKHMTTAEFRVTVPSEQVDPDFVDKSDLAELIATVEGYKASSYTEESWAAFAEALKAAKAVNADEFAEQADVDDALDALAAAVAGLERELKIIPVDKLTASAGSEQTLSGNNSTEGPARFVLDDNTGTLWHTDWNGTAAANRWIQFAIDGDYEVTGLTYLPRTDAGGSSAFGVITSYTIMVSNDGTTWENVTTGTWANNAELKIAEFDAQEVKYVRLFADAAVSDHRLFASAATIRLLGAEAVVVVPVDKVALQAAIDSVALLTEADYTVDSWAALQIALDAAKLVNNKEDATQEAVDAAAADLQEMIEALEEAPIVADKTALQALIEEAESLNADDYTADSWAALRESIKEASRVYNDSEAGQELVDLLLADLQEKIDALVKKPAEPDVPSTPVTTIFEDVADTDWFADEVQYVYDKGIMTGTSETTFEPNLGVTRATIVQTLYKLEGKPGVSDFTKYDSLDDTLDSIWWRNGLAWALNEGVAKGDSKNNVFNPDNEVTREDLATFIYRYAQYKGVDVELERTADEILGDTFVNSWAKDAFAWAIETGLIKGKTINGASDLAPQVGATRAELATIMMRFYENNDF